MAVAAADVVTLFAELAALPSPSRCERAVADRVLAFLRALGLEASEDGSGAATRADAGNVLCRIPSTVPGTPIFFCVHMDTVPPTAAVEPVVEDGIVRNGAGTILGADNKAAVAVVLEAARRLVEERRPHAGVELVLTTGEELGMLGARAFDHDALEARVGFVYDEPAPIGRLVLGAPHQRTIDVRFHGRAAHAGVNPEEGRSAIVAAARAVADLRLGRLDEETTANVGTIAGGSARNVVPEWCSFVVDARSHDARKLADLVQEILDACAFAAGLAECELETTVREHAHGYRLQREGPAIVLARTALERTGHVVSHALTGGGTDANVFNERGRECVVLANGMAGIHSPEERIAVADLEAMVEVTLALVDAARAGA